MMGQLASKIKAHYVTRNLQRYNIEARTEKILKADELRPSPRYVSPKLNKISLTFNKSILNMRDNHDLKW